MDEECVVENFLLMPSYQETQSENHFDFLSFCHDYREHRTLNLTTSQRRDS